MNNFSLIGSILFLYLNACCDKESEDVLRVCLKQTMSLTRPVNSPVSTE